MLTQYITLQMYVNTMRTNLYYTRPHYGKTTNQVTGYTSKSSVHGITNNHTALLIDVMILLLNVSNHTVHRLQRYK